MPKEKGMRIFVRIGITITLLVAALSTPLGAFATAQNWTVTTGGTQDQAIQALVFGPAKLTVDQGDGVTWHIGSGEPHTISFGWPSPINPASPEATTPVAGTAWDGTNKVSSGLAFKDYTLTITAAPGTYTYLCLIHPGMAGQLVVQAPGTAYPQTQDQASATGNQQIQAAIGATQALVAAANVTQARGAGGSTTWTVPSSVGSGNAYSARFLGGDLTVKVGDTVTWTDTDPVVPHTVTFSSGGPTITPAQPGFEKYFAPSGGNTYNGTGLVNSGLYGPVPGAPKSYSLQFTAPGTYKYYCILHAELGMVGTITVVGGAPIQAPVQAPAALPKTGSGSGVPGVPAWSYVLGAVLLGGAPLA